MPQSKIKLGFWIFCSAVLGIFLASLIYPVFKNSSYKKILRGSAGEAVAIKFTQKEKPKYFYLNKDENGGPGVSAVAYVVGDLDTDEVILTKNQEVRFPIASISKLMTALVAEETIGKDEIVQISKKTLETEGGNGDLKVGEKIKTGDLVYPLLLESSNDASEILAEYLGRGAFVKKMNETAQNLKMFFTYYEDPSGLSPNNQSTAFDLFKFLTYLKEQKPDLLQITTKKSYSNEKHNWSSNNQFLEEDGYLGGKSGYTDEAKQTVVSLFSLPLGDKNNNVENRYIGITLLGSQDRYRDVENILQYLKKNIYYGNATDANADWVKQKISILIRDPDFVRLAFVGDIMLDRGVKNSVIKNFNNDYSALFEKLKILKEFNIVFGNLEGTASDKGRDQGNLYSFNMDPAVVPALAGSGIDILSVANNHVGDFGREAYIDTLSRLKENEILYTGGGNNEMYAEQPAIIEKYGMKIGYLGFSDVGPSFMEAGADMAGLLLTSDPNFEGIIKNASSQVDHLVVSFHFGEEYQEKHNARQEYLAHTAVDNGAKIVVGHHPHVVEDTEVYKNSFIAYSLGNFIFDQKFSAETMEGMLLEIKLYKNGEMFVKKNMVKLNSAFQPDKIIKGKEEKIKF